MGGAFLRRPWKYDLGTLKIIPRTLPDDHNHPSIAIKSRNLSVAHCWFPPLWNYRGLLKQQPAADHWGCWRAETDEQATKVGSASFCLLVVPWSGLTRIRISQKAEIRGQLRADTFPPYPPATPRAALCPLGQLCVGSTGRAQGSRTRTGHGTRQEKNRKPG